MKSSSISSKPLGQRLQVELVGPCTSSHWERILLAQLALLQPVQWAVQRARGIKRPEVGISPIRAKRIRAKRSLTWCSVTVDGGQRERTTRGRTGAVDARRACGRGRCVTCCRPLVGVQLQGSTSRPSTEHLHVTTGSGGWESQCDRGAPGLLAPMRVVVQRKRLEAAVGAECGEQGVYSNCFLKLRK